MLGPAWRGSPTRERRLLGLEVHAYEEGFHEKTTRYQHERLAKAEVQVTAACIF